MLAGRRWRDWNPPAILQEGPERKLTKLTEPKPRPFSSVLSVPTLPVSGRSSEYIRIPPAYPDAWRMPFVEWLDSACALHPSAFGGVAALHRAYFEWEIARNGVPCTRETFERLLGALGLLLEGKRPEFLSITHKLNCFGY